MMTLLWGSLLLLVVMASPVEAQRRCTKGIPCGNSCIAATKTCRIGTTPAPKPETATPPTAAPIVPLPAAGTTSKDTLFVGSRVDQVFFLRSCVAAQDLAPENRRYFRTEQEAFDAKYRRSRVPGC